MREPLKCEKCGSENIRAHANREGPGEVVVTVLCMDPNHLGFGGEDARIKYMREFIMRMTPGAVYSVNDPKGDPIPAGARSAGPDKEGVLRTIRLPVAGKGRSIL